MNQIKFYHTRMEILKSEQDKIKVIFLQSEFLLQRFTHASGIEFGIAVI